jgi:hypothetical protein
MKMHKKIHFIFLIAMSALVVVSCRPTGFLTFEIPKAGKNILPEHIQSLTLVTRTPSASYKNLRSDSLQRLFFIKTFNFDTLINDLTSLDTTLLALGNLLYESGRYDIVVPKNRFLVRTRSLISPQMEWNEVDELCKTYKTDAILSLEHFKTRVVTSFSRKNVQSMSYFSMNTPTATMNILCEAYFRVYDNKTKKIVYRELIKDTLYWEDYDSMTTELFKRFTPVKQGLTEAGISIALELSDKIGINWIPHARIYFSNGNRELKNAAQLVNSNNNEEALKIWKEVALTAKSKSLKSKAEYNVSLGYEIKGDLDEALVWALKSYNTMFRTLTYDYLEFLKKRKDEK